MKILLQQVFSHKNPLYLLSTYLRTLGYPSHHYRKIFRGIGKVKHNLFEDSLYDGIEFDAHHVDVFFYKRWRIDWKRIEKFKKQGLPIEAVHAHYPSGVRMLRRSDLLLNLAVRSPLIVEGLKAHIEITANLVKDKKILVVHPGVVKEDTSDFEAVENVVATLKQCLEELERRAVFLCLENLNPHYGLGLRNIGDNYKVLGEILTRVNHPNIKIVYDWGHANAFARDFYERNKENLAEDYLTNFLYHKELINNLGREIVYAHLNYNPAHDLHEVLLKNFFVTGWDYHMGLNKIPQRWLSGYKEVMKLLCEKTSIKEFGKVLLEIRPHRLFRIFDFSSFGVTDEEAIKTLKLLRNWFEEFDVQY